MKRSITKAIASVAVCGAGLAGSLVLVPPATSAAPDAPRAERPSSKITDLGYKATVYGTKVLVDGVEVRTLKDAFAQQRCTRQVGLEQIANSGILSIPDNPLIQGGLTKSYTQTYRTNGIQGVRGISEIANLQLGGELGGQQTPTLSLVGLKSTADAFRKADGTFGHAEGFTFEGLKIGNLPEQIPAPLQDLLDILTSNVGNVVNQVLDLLSSVTGNTIEIPGLGSIGLAGVKSGYANKSGAASQSYALRLTLDVTGHPTTLTLGRARTAVSSPVPAGVFQSRAMGLELFGGNDLIRLGGLQEQAIGCSGTPSGKVQTHKVGDVRVLGGLVNLTGVEYLLKGDQQAKGSANGFVSSKIGALEVPSIGLVIDGITSKVSLFKPKNTTKVKRTIDTSLARITLNGEEIALPDPGEVIDLGNNNLLRYRVVKQNWTGAEVKALVLTLPDLIPGGSILELGWAGAHISPN